MFLIIHLYEAVFSCFQLYQRFSVGELFYQRSVLYYQINPKSDIDMIQQKSKPWELILLPSWSSEHEMSFLGRSVQSPRIRL